MNNKSSLEREHIIDQLSGNEYDLLIIGGGITGAGIALDAASRGLKTALIEKLDFASGTSSRSTKLIHGGLRYLKQLEFVLVAEVGGEREVVYNNAPHLVVPEKMLLPLVKGGTFGKFSTSIGLWIYDLLAGVKRDERRVMLNKLAALKVEPLLKKDTLLGAGQYTEYRTDDARLTWGVMSTAIDHGAIASNYVKADQFIYENDKIIGVDCIDELTKNTFQIKAKQVVNATGPWVDKVRARDHTIKGKYLHLTKGVHIVVSNKKLPIRSSIYFDVSDGRMIFAIPRGGITYIGTTDTTYTGQLEEPKITNDDKKYLIDAVNATFEGVNLLEEDIISGWCGLRPLIHEEGKSPSELSRKDEIFVSDNGLISIAGGKLTGYRQMAKKTVDLVYKILNKEAVECKTKHIKIIGGNFSNPGDVSDYIQEVRNQLTNKNILGEEAEYLIRNYGKQTAIILDLIQTDDNPEESLLKAELLYCLEYEMIQTPEDFLLRRTGRCNFRPESVKKLGLGIVKLMAEKLNWSDLKTTVEMEKWGRPPVPDALK